MQVKCKYCGNEISDNDRMCPFCGAPNDKFKRVANGVPITIEELKAWARGKNCPLEDLRFFIGIDYKEPKAFGIYKDDESGRFVVYKNKADGTRAVRYEGDDEAYAVNEIYMKIKEEALKATPKQTVTPNPISKEDRKPKKHKLSDFAKTQIELTILLFVIMTALLIGSIIITKTPADTYFENTTSQSKIYHNDDIRNNYYNNSRRTTLDNSIWDNESTYNDNSSSYDYDYDYDYDDSSSWSSGDSWSSSDNSSWNSDWDSGWDSGSSWSSGTDWGSDW
mgnify:CR=1 FL=1